jgi:hypothetical protein
MNLSSPWKRFAVKRSDSTKTVAITFGPERKKQEFPTFFDEDH